MNAEPQIPTVGHSTFTYTLEDLQRLRECLKVNEWKLSKALRAFDDGRTSNFMSWLEFAEKIFDDSEFPEKHFAKTELCFRMNSAATFFEDECKKLGAKRIAETELWKMAIDSQREIMETFLLERQYEAARQRCLTLKQWERMLAERTGGGKCS